MSVFFHGRSPAPPSAPAIPQWVVLIRSCNGAKPQERAIPTFPEGVRLVHAGRWADVFLVATDLDESGLRAALAPLNLGELVVSPQRTYSCDI